MGGSVVTALPRRLFARRRGASHTRIQGRVRDADHGRTLAHVSVVVRREGLELALRTDATGAFDAGPMGDGPVEILVQAPGYLPLRVEGAVPHRGELAALELRVVSVRSELLRRYAALLAPHLPPAASLGLATPRELASLASAFVDQGTLRELRMLVEVACYGEDRAAASWLDRVDALGQGLRAPRGS